MKKILIIFLSCFNSVIHLYSESSDTVRIRKDVVDAILYGSGYMAQDGVYSVNEKIVSKEIFDIITNEIDSVSDFLRVNGYKYFIFLSPDNKIIEEGYWSYEIHFSGYYKSYYSNGNIKEEGYYTELCDSTFLPGQKIGEWKYYYNSGKIIKKINFFPKEKWTNSKSDPIILPCTCMQKYLYKNKNCITLLSSRLRGRTYRYSTDSIFNQKYTPSINIEPTPIELKFLQKYASEFMDSVFSKNECIKENVFVIKIYEHNVKDTLLEFFISYIKSKDNLDDFLIFHSKNIYYITINGRKVLIKLSSKLKNDELKKMFSVLNRKKEITNFNENPYEEDFSNYFNYSSNDSYEKVYKGEYKMHGGLIETTFSSPFYINIPSKEQLFSD